MRAAGPAPGSRPTRLRATRGQTAGRRGLPSPAIIALALLLAAGAVLMVLRLAPRRNRVPCGPDLPCPESLYVGGDAMRERELFHTMLRRLGVAPARVEQAAAALRLTDFNFRTLRPGDSVTLFCRGLELEALNWHKDAATSYRVRFDSTGAAAARFDAPVDTVRAVVAGTVRTSIWHSLVGLGEGPWLVMAFTDILRYDIDFFTESNDGDTFEIVVDKFLVDSAFYKYGRVHAARYRGRNRDYWGFYFRDARGHWDYYNEKGQSLRKTILRSPLEFRKVTSHFGMRFHPIHRVYRQHHGVDYGAPSGTPVSAIADGSIAFAGWRGGYGRLVEIRHAGGLSSRYGHLSGFGPGVRTGARARQGQTIGYVGMTGDATGPHLHFETRQGGKPVNPAKLIPPRAEPVPDRFRAEFNAVRDACRAEVERARAPGAAPPDSSGR
ncbi:MAG: M23 family metallopeptidase [bacterium]